VSSRSSPRRFLATTGGVIIGSDAALVVDAGPRQRRHRLDGWVLLERRAPPRLPLHAQLPPLAATGLTRLNRDMDRLNVLSTYRAIESE
jgi:hypothetical protein